MAILGLILTLVGGIAALYFSILILIENFKENVIWGIASLFLGIPMLVFVIMRWDQVGQTFLKYLGCAVVAFLGMILSGAGAMSGM